MSYGIRVISYENNKCRLQFDFSATAQSQNWNTAAKYLNECEHYNKSVWIEKERKNK